MCSMEMKHKGWRKKLSRKTGGGREQPGKTEGHVASDEDSLEKREGRGKERSTKGER